MNSKRFTGDPLEVLRRADPLDSAQVPQDTSGPHARALFQEVITMTPADHAPAPRRTPLLRRIALGAAAAAIVAVAAGGAYAFLRGDAEEVIVGGQPIGGDPMAMCIQYSDEMLAGLDYAFDGTLVSANADGSQVVFEVHSWFKGGEGDQVTLSAEGLMSETSIALVGASLKVGERYLAAGDDGFVWACGFTVTYDTALADHWAELFGA